MGSSSWNKNKGFEYALFSAPSGKAECLVIFMHGVGHNAKNFDEAAYEIQRRIPGADVISLQAPTEFEVPPEFSTGEKGYTWFPYEGPLTPQAKAWLTHIFNRLTIADKVEAFASDELQKRGLKEDKLAYFGISMGAIVALQVALSGKNEVAAVVSSGGTVPPFTKIRRKPKIFLQMGEFDDIFNVPPRKGKGKLSKAFARAAEELSIRHERSVKRLKKKGVPVTEKTYPGEGHILPVAAYKDGIDFLVSALTPPSPPAPQPKPGL